VTVYGAVFARGGSKGVASKNLRRIAGTSLLELAVTMGLRSPVIDRMLCSTDSREIGEAAARLGAEVPFSRPESLSQDESPEWLAWQHLAHFLLGKGAVRSDVLVSLPATAPLRDFEDIDNAFLLFQQGSFDLVLGVSESARSPWFNMVAREPTSEVALVASVGGKDFSRRQDVPPTFDITTVIYVTTLGFVVDSAGLFEGKVGSVIVPSDRAIDIDTEFDLEIADYLLRKRLGLKYD